MFLPTVQYIIGRQKTGVTTYLTHKFLEQGGAFFDFTGNPPIVLSDFSYFDPRYPVPFNILKHKDAPRILLDSIKSAYNYDGSTPVLDLYVLSATAALQTVPDASLLGMPYLFMDKGYRTKVIGHIRDPLLKKFWTGYETLSEKDKRTETFSTLNKIYTLLLDEQIRNVLGQKKTLAIRDPLIATFPPSLGREKQSFLSTLLLHILPDMPVILDGGHMLGANAVLARSDVTFAHRYLAQLAPTLREALLGSADTVTVFSVGPSDARRLEREFPADRNRSTLLELSPFRYHERRDGRTQYDLAVPVPDFPKGSMSKALNEIPKREHVEASITRFLQSVAE